MAAAPTRSHRATAPATDRRSGNGTLPAISYERHRGAAGAPLPPAYRRRQPENTVLHAVVREHLETFLAVGSRRKTEKATLGSSSASSAVTSTAGCSARGFARLQVSPPAVTNVSSPSPAKDGSVPVASGGGWPTPPPSWSISYCPEAPYRQWVLTFPWALRFRLAVDRPLFSALLGGFLRTVFAWQRRRGRAARHRRRPARCGHLRSALRRCPQSSPSRSQPRCPTGCSSPVPTMVTSSPSSPCPRAPTQEIEAADAQDRPPTHRPRRTALRR